MDRTLERKMGVARLLADMVWRTIIQRIRIHGEMPAAYMADGYTRFGTS